MVIFHVSAFILHLHTELVDFSFHINNHQALYQYLMVFMSKGNGYFTSSTQYTPSPAYSAAST